MERTKAVPVMSWEIKIMGNKDSFSIGEKIKSKEIKDFIADSHEGEAINMLTPHYERAYLFCSQKLYLSEEGYFDDTTSGAERIPKTLIVHRVINCGSNRFMIIANDYEVLTAEYMFLLKGNELSKI